MRIIARSKLRDFWQKKERGDSEQPLRAWFDQSKHANWKRAADIKKQYRNASVLPNNRVAFNIHGNKYLLIVAFKYEFGIGYIRFIGTHRQYDNIDAGSV